jgi:hypothetical protein
MAQNGFTPISIYYSTTASAVPTAANLVPGELAINTNDGKLYYEDSSGVVQTLASKAGALGDVVGPASATDNALARFDLTTGKLIQNSVGILSDAGILTGLTGLTSSGSITFSSLTSGRVTYAGASGLLSDSAGLTYDGTNLTTTGTATATRFIPSGSTVATNGMYLPAANTLGFSTNSTQRLTITSDGNVGINATPSNYADYVTLALNDTTGSLIELKANATANAELVSDNNGFMVKTVSSTPLRFGTVNTEQMRIDSSGNLLVGTTTASANFYVYNAPVSYAGLNATAIFSSSASQSTGTGGLIAFEGKYTSGGALANFAAIGGLKENSTDSNYSGYLGFYTRLNGNLAAERMRIDSSGNVLVGKTVNDTTTNGCNISASGRGSFSSNGQAVGDFNRTGDDGTIINFLQDGTIEGTISVSGSTVSYNGGHLSRWSQWQNQSGQPDIYRGTVLESTNDMCEWSQTNEQSTKTIVSTTAKSKAVAGVFDMYDFDDKTNPNDFYVAQSGDFVIRIAQGVVIENGDLLESAGDGTARPQTDDICRSSTIAKVTSNYVSTTYADGSFCVPCILMIG